MASLSRSTTVVSSVFLRVLAYIFIRWIPGHLIPPGIAALATIYVTSFYATVRSNNPYEVVEDDIDIVTKPVEIEDEDTITVAQANGVSDDDGPLEELDVEETIVLEEKEPRIIYTLLTGAPSPSSFFWTLTTFLINVLLVLMIVDGMYRARYFHQAQDLSFARLGYVSDTTAKILIREPDLTQLPMHLSYRHADRPSTIRSRLSDAAWRIAGSIHTLSNETDYTATITITHLHPDTRYQYALSYTPSTHSTLSNTDYFVTAPKPGHLSRRLTEATNTQADTMTPLTFLHTSCLIPNFPYSPFSHPLSIPGFKYLSKWVQNLKPAFLLFLGDFIYIDVPRRHGTTIETYRREYRQVYASPDWPSVQGTYPPSIPPSDLHDSYADHAVPWIHVWDDHEVANDYGGDIANTSLGLFPAALDPYTNYHVAPNPPPHRKPHSLHPSSAYFSFTHGPASFFLLDTRRFRTAPSHPSSTMLGATQLSDLLAWLSAPPPSGIRFKIIISSVPFTKNWRFNSDDTWAGYLAERRTILHAAWDLNARDSPFAGTAVVILSGDRHEFAATSFPPPANESARWPASAAVTEFSVSPLSMFYLPVRTYRQGKGDLEDVCLKYHPEGNSKFGVVTIGEESGSGQAALRYRLVVDGVEKWSHVLLTGARVEGLGGEVWREGLWS